MFYQEQKLTFNQFHGLAIRKIGVVFYYYVYLQLNSNVMWCFFFVVNVLKR